jgi:hypothetical protein
MVAYLALVLIYRGDFALEQFRYAVEFAFRLGVDGHEFGTVLLGEVHRTPPIWAYPVVLFFKTPLAFWLLLLTAIVVLGLRATDSTWRMLLSSRLRAPLVAIVIMGSTLVWSNASVASRYAIPLLVLLATVVAAGIGVLWTTASRPIRGGLAAALLVHVASALSFYPNFLAYVNEAGPDSNEAYKLFTSGNVDLGQGLLELKRWMREHDQEYVYLAYHGVGDPAGYGIRYVPLRSWFPLADDAWPAPDSIPKYAAISTHWLVDESASSPFASYRGQEPAAVVGHVFLIFETKGRPPLGLLEMNRASMTEESPQGRGHRVPAL